MLILVLDNLYSNDMELRLLLKRVWPNITKKTLDRVIPKRPQGKSILLIWKKESYFAICFPWLIAGYYLSVTTLVNGFIMRNYQKMTLLANFRLF